MLTKNGAIITDMRGKLGGQVYSKNRYGKFVCNSYAPTNPRTSYQQQNRMYLANSVANWKQLTEHERLSWNSAAMYLKGYNCFGDSFSYTAYNCYIKCSSVFLAMNNTPLGACPRIAVPMSFRGFAVNINSEEQLFLLDYGSPTQLDLYTFIYATRPLNAGRKPKTSDYRRIFINGGTSPDDYAVTEAYVAYFGSFPAIGAVVHFKLCSADPVNGLISSPLVASATCASYLLPITPYNLNLASFDPDTGVLSLQASTNAFACLAACDFSKPFSFRVRLLTVYASSVIRINFATIATRLLFSDNRNKYRFLPSPVASSWLFNILGSTLGGAPVVSVNDYMVFSYDGTNLLIYSGAALDDLTLCASIKVSFTDVAYINICPATAVAMQVDSLAFYQ